MIRRRKRRKKLAQILPDLMNVYRYFWRDIRKKSGLITTSFLALLAGVVFRLLEPWPLKFVLDEVFKGQSNAPGTITLPESWSVNGIVLFVALAVIAIAAMRAFMDYTSRVGFFKVGNYVVIKIRDRVYRHLQALPMKFHDGAKHGDLITRVTRDVSLLRDVTATAMLPLLGSTMVLLGMALVMLWLNWKLALVSLIIIPLYWLTTVRLGRQIRLTARKQRERESAMATIASEAIGNIRSIKAMQIEEKFATDFDRKNNQSQTDDLKASRLSLRLGRTVDVLLAFATACVMWLGAHLVLKDQMQVGDLVLFLVYLKRSFKPAQEFAKYTARLAKATAAGERIISLLERKPENLRSDCKPLVPGPGEIHFDSVNFAYDNDQLVLKDFNLTVQPQETIAIVGSSGIGKSTLINLLLGYYTPSSGQILIDGQDIGSVSLESWRSQFGVVLQNPQLFAGTIRENIAVANPEATQEQIIRAARLAEVDEFASQLPAGYDSVLEERSNNLSRGQRQRIAIARTAIDPRPFLLLDEPTTGLDETNRLVVGQALVELASTRTSIWVTHDLRVAESVDRVAVFDNGQIVEIGSHQELMDRGGKYSLLVQSQLAGSGATTGGSQP